MKNILLILFFFSFPAITKAGSFALKANAGTLGFGLEGAAQIHESINVRLGANLMGYSYLYQSNPEDEFDIDGSLRLSNFLALVDWYPFKSGFHLTGGLMYNNNNINIGLLPKQTYTVGGDTYTPDDLGSLSAELTFNPVVPYAALGFGNPFKGSRFGVNTDIGLFFQGAPKVSMEAQGLLEPSAEQAPLLEENVNWFTLYPVLTLSLYYRIN